MMKNKAVIPYVVYFCFVTGLFVRHHIREQRAPEPVLPYTHTYEGIPEAVVVLETILSEKFMLQSEPVQIPASPTEADTTEAPEEHTEPPEPVFADTPPETQPPVIPLLNLNTVTKELLLLLPGCTEQIAENILFLRDVQIHKIYNPLEILMAEGVTDELFLRWQPYLAVDDAGSTQLPLDD